MKKKILLTLMSVAILGFIVYVNLTSRTVYNDEMTIGNTPGNIMNNGYFCENGDTIYFSNANDYDKLYSMDLNCSNFKRLGKTAVSDISCAGTYIFYASRNNKYKDVESSSAVGDVLSSGGIGLFRCNLNGSHTQNLYSNAVGNATLAGNYIYYQHYDSENGLKLYKVKLDETEGTCLYTGRVNPAGIYNGNMYFAGTEEDHNIYKMSLFDDSYDKFYEGNCSNVIVFENNVYFLDLNNNYALTRVNMQGKKPELVVNDRVLTYNFSFNGKYLYYQIDNENNSRICQMNMETGEEHILLKGNFCDINVTSNYVFFKGFKTDHVYVIAVEDNPKLNIFDPPILK